MLIITMSTIAVQGYELYYSVEKTSTTYVWMADIVFIVATLTELVLKVIKSF